MNFTDFISQMKSYPVLFFGSGMTKRYFENSPTWEELLQKSYESIGIDLVTYKATKNSLRHTFNKISDNGLYAKLGTKIEDLYETEYLKIENDLNNQVREKMHLEDYRSAYKVMLSLIFGQLVAKNDEELQQELRALKRAENKISTFITTNYDTFLEDLFPERKVYLSNDIVLSEPYSAIYKMHGSSKNPDSIVITEDDYQLLSDNSDVMFAQFTTLLFRNPVIFLGYSINDESVQEMLKSVFKSALLNKKALEKMERNFLIVNYNPTETNLEIENFTIQLGGDTTFTIQRLNTNDFLNIFENIQKIKQTTDVHTLKQIKNLVSIIEDGDKSSKPKVLANPGFDGIPDSEIVIAVATADTIFIMPDRYQMLEDCLLELPNFEQKYKDLCISNLLSKESYAPYFKLQTLMKGNSNFDERISKQKQRCENMLKVAENKIRSGKVYSSVKTILLDKDIPKSYKFGEIVSNFNSNNISQQTLKEFLIQEVQEMRKRRQTLSIFTSTEISKLVAFYDFKVNNCNN